MKAHGTKWSLLELAVFICAFYGFRIAEFGCSALPASSNEHYFPNYAAAEGAPEIIPLQEDILLERDSSYTLKCESNAPVAWHLTTPTTYDIVYTTESFVPVNPDRPYGSLLHLYNITASNVGYYYCVKKEFYDETYVDPSDVESWVEDFKAARIYVFVNDWEVLLVPFEVPVFSAQQYQEVTIPCKPSNGKTEVVLTNPNREILSSETSYDKRPSGIEYRFDPKLGFIVEIRNISDGGSYNCRPKEPSEFYSDEIVQIEINYSAKTQYVNKPIVTSPSNGHVIAGENLTLQCQVLINPDVQFELTWDVPVNAASRVSTSKTTKETKDSQSVGKSVLTITDVQKTDSGEYRCKVRDHSNNKAHNHYLITVLNKGENYINITEPNGLTKVEEDAGRHAQFVVVFRGYPPLTLTWYKPDQSVIHPMKKFNLENDGESAILKINSLELRDTGLYTLEASNGFATKTLNFTLYVKDKPTVSVNSVYVQEGEEARLVCKAEAYPKAMVAWMFYPCSLTPEWPTCQTNYEPFNGTRNVSPDENEIESIRELIFTPTRPGIIKCVAINPYGNSSADAEIMIGDLKEKMVVSGIEDEEKIARDDEVVLTCAALAYHYTDDLEWYRNEELVKETDDDVQIVASYSEYTHKKALKFKAIQQEHAGVYECRAKTVKRDDGHYDSQYLVVTVHEPEAPVFEKCTLNKDIIKRNLGESLDLVCKAQGIPKPVVTWYKDDMEIQNNSNVSIEEDGSVLRIPFLKPEDQGYFKCFVSNRLGSLERTSRVKIANMPGMHAGWIIGIVALILILIVLIVCLVIRMMKARRLLADMKAAGLANFEEGDLEQINPALTLDEQADLLPYDPKFEFPKDKLKLGKQLGAGAFGVVLKASAEGICPDEKETTVAVKMVKRNADNEVTKALVSELKIMVHLGQHLNVVNLLGAVTKNIAKREVLVIVEYCKYGNLQSFLMKNRKRFINQINPETDLIDPTITVQRFSENFDYNSSGNDPRYGTRSAGRLNSHGYVQQPNSYYDGNVDSCTTETTVMSSGAEGNQHVLSNNSVQPAWRSNYKPDSTEAMEITTSNLVSWAFQVARGMEYLASRKVLHGDLAARNILLCEDNVVKICDFGLARSMYNSENYKKQGDSKLPIKWLALESLGDQVFSTYTDVWSFGIVLWEFFSLAMVPYPGMLANDLYFKLKDGYRMEKPPYANQELYDIMLQCWSTNPESRPLFYELEQKFAKLLEDEVTNHYLALNEPYMRMNSEYFSRKDMDYMALMGPPDELAPSVPAYVNGKLLPEIRIDPSTDEDYLQMSTRAGTAIFSPTRPRDDYVKPDHFVFPEKPTSPSILNNLDDKSRKNTATTIPEAVPMLRSLGSAGEGDSGLSDSDDDDQPSPPPIGRNFRQLNRPASPIVDASRPSERYANLKSTASDLRNKFLGSNGAMDAFSNPGYLMFKPVNEGRK